MLPTVVGAIKTRSDEQSVAHGAAGRAVSEVNVVRRGPVNGPDYEVLDSASESCHYSRNGFLGLHGMTFLGVFSSVLFVGRTRAVSTDERRGRRHWP